MDGVREEDMKPRVSFLIIMLVLFAFSAGALTAEDLAGTYVGKWTDDLATGIVNRYDAVVVWEADSQVSTYRYIEFPGFYYASGVTEIEEDGSFVIGNGSASDKSRGRSVLILGRGTLSQFANLLAASTFARPNSVIRPSLMIFSTRLRFVADQLLLSFLGVNFRQYLSPSILLMILSIQPRQRASSTAAS